MRYVIRTNLPTPKYYVALCYGYHRWVYEINGGTEFSSRAEAEECLANLTLLHFPTEVVEVV